MGVREDLFSGLKDPSLLRTESLINGAWVGGGRRFSVTNPATGELIAEVVDCGEAETRLAIEAASAALPAWKGRLAKERSEILKAWHRLIVENADDLALLMTMEQGKPLAEARGEVLYAASFVEWFAEEAKRVYGEVIPPTALGRQILVTKEPIGVTAAITPWNFPAAMITRKCGPGLAVGCTSVAKPAEATPLTALALGELAIRAGFPPGVFNIVTGSGSSAPEIGRTLCGDSRVRKLSFTGSTEVGRLLFAQSAPTIKKLSLELGGNAPFIVFDDADLDQAVEGLMAAKFRNAGQTCVCPNRIYVQSSIMDAFAQRLVGRVESLKVGSGLDSGVQIGPLIEAAALEKVEAHVKDALSKGARLMTGGARHPYGGLFFQPTVLSHVPEGVQLSDEETFGPVAPLFGFESEDEVLRRANHTEFGLAAYVYTRDLGRAFRVANGLESGMVSVNAGAFSNEVAPFGGVKQSGLGREGSRHGVEEYLEMKYITLGGLA